jgi:hypothetical protein
MSLQQIFSVLQWMSIRTAIFCQQEALKVQLPDLLPGFGRNSSTVVRLSYTSPEVLDQFCHSSLSVIGLKGLTLCLPVKNQTDPSLLKQLHGNQFSE